MKTKQIVCINWGTKYGPPFINRLYAMVQRNITPPFRFVCFTDSEVGIRPEVECHPLPPVSVEVPQTIGIWDKTRLWAPQLADLEGTVLFLDLDIVITGNIDELFNYGDQDRVIITRDPVKPLGRHGQTSVYRFPVGGLVSLLDKFCENPQEILRTYVREQNYLTKCAPGGVDFFPNRWVRHFRLHCMRTLPLNYFRQPKLPSNAKIIIFPGGIHPNHAIQGGWMCREAITRKQHLLDYRQLKLEGENLLSYLQHYTLPTKWIDDLWRE